MIRVRTQDFRGGKKKTSVEIISIDQFCQRARKLSGFKLTDRALVSNLLELPLMNTLHFPDEGGVFWLEK